MIRVRVAVRRTTGCSCRLVVFKKKRKMKNVSCEYDRVNVWMVGTQLCKLRVSCNCRLLLCNCRFVALHLWDESCTCTYYNYQTIQTVVLTADVFQLFIKTISSDSPQKPYYYSIRTCLMYHAACKVEFQPFKRSYSQLTFKKIKIKKYRRNMK